jgi:hypothetical protein
VLELASVSVADSQSLFAASATVLLFNLVVLMKVNSVLGPAQQIAASPRDFGPSWFSDRVIQHLQGLGLSSYAQKKLLETGQTLEGTVEPAWRSFM